tara:strand:- start:9588 stop:10307 length:720 start_codon:yes stop_codon:yes gene_type:complete
MNRKKLKVDKKIYTKTNKWTFANKIAPKFDSHIKKSIPIYQDIRWLSMELSDYFLREGSNVYDIGSSTGSFLNELSSRNNFKKIKFYGVEVVKEMVNYANKNFKKKNISYLNKDLTKLKFKKSDYITSFFTIQFIEQKHRQVLINKIFKSLNWGGAFFYAEKIRYPDGRSQDMMNEIYKEWKLQNGFSLNEVNSKTKSLKGILDPFSSKGNLTILKNAGFKDIYHVAKFINFEAFLAIK